MADSYLLVIHGSRNPRPHQQAAKLAQLVRQQLAQLHQTKSTTDWLQPTAIATGANQHPNQTLVATSMVETAALEMAATPLHQQIETCARATAAQGGKRVKVLPLFLLAGVHVREDIPTQVDQARQNLKDCPIKLEVEDYLGNNQAIVELLADKFDELNQKNRILIAHGSRRQGANQQLEAIANQLNAEMAYWSVAPSLSTQVERLIAQGQNQIGIVPYFLFAGGITEAIATEVDQLQKLYPETQIRCSQPLGATAQLAQILIAQIAA